MSERCPTCGHMVRAVAGENGTSSYVPIHAPRPLPGDASERRAEVHDAGGHTVPQVDCWKCWRTGAFDDAETEGAPPQPVPIHDGRHGDSCVVCMAR